MPPSFTTSNDVKSIDFDHDITASKPPYFNIIL